MSIPPGCVPSLPGYEGRQLVELLPSASQSGQTAAGQTNAEILKFKSLETEQQICYKH